MIIGCCPVHCPARRNVCRTLIAFTDSPGYDNPVRGIGYSRGSSTKHLWQPPFPCIYTPQAAHFTGLCRPPSLRLGPSPRRATPPAPHTVVLPPRPAADGAVSADMFLLVVSCFIRAVHCAPPLGEEGWVVVAGDEGEPSGKGFGPEHLGEVDALSRVAADIFRCDAMRYS